MTTMAKTYKVRNISNRPMELIFGESSERIDPHKTGVAHSEAEWKDSIAKQQAETFEQRHEAKIIVGEAKPDGNNVEARAVNANVETDAEGKQAEKQTSKNTKKGDK